jgi:methylglyoxal/glyoxal reductase
MHIVAEKKVPELTINSTVTLNNGVEMPLFGLGVLQAKEGGEVENAVKTALIHGYRKIDTAQAYHNERGVGIGIKESGVPRDKIFLVSKVGNNDQGYHKTKVALEKSLNELQTDYLDLYLIHWPRLKITIETWKAMEELYKQGKIRAIGVSNFLFHHLEDVLRFCQVVPAVNQVEYHPELIQPELVDYCKSKNILFQAYRPLIQGRVNHIPEIMGIAEKHGKTPAQIVLRWNIQKGIATIPKSTNKERIISNADIFNFQLGEEDMAVIDSLDKNERTVQHDYRIKFLIHAFITQNHRIKLFKILICRLFKKIQGVFSLLALKWIYINEWEICLNQIA